MIDLYYWTTPNGHKVTLFLEEAKIPYRLIPVNIGAGEQFQPDFLKISPNNRIPAIVDHAPHEGSDPIVLFESGAILLYLAEKIGRFIPRDTRSRVEVLQWLFWQMGGLGPMAGQNHHFSQYAPEKIPYAINRYVNETSRLYAVLNQHLTHRTYIASQPIDPSKKAPHADDTESEYSIADMACYPWVVPYERQGQNLNEFPHLKRWFETIHDRPATVQAYDLVKSVNPSTMPLDEKARKILFSQSSKSLHS